MSLLSACTTKMPKTRLKEYGKSFSGLAESQKIIWIELTRISSFV